MFVQPAIGVHLPELVQPVLVCFEDQDARVRYYACEALYNISKVARVAILVFFNTIFEGLIKASRGYVCVCVCVCVVRAGVQVCIQCACRSSHTHACVVRLFFMCARMPGQRNEAAL